MAQQLFRADPIPDTVRGVPVWVGHAILEQEGLKVLDLGLLCERVARQFLTRSDHIV